MKPNTVPSETPEYKEQEAHCDRFARQLADQLLSRLNNTLFDDEIKRVIVYPRQLILEKAVKLLSDQI